MNTLQTLCVILLWMFMAHGEVLDPLTALSAEQWEVLGRMKADDLPESMKTLLRTNRAAGDSSHWCCKINPTKTIVNTHSRLQYRATSHKEKHYHHCHTFGWGRCSSYTTVYAQRVNRSQCCCPCWFHKTLHCLQQFCLRVVWTDGKKATFYSTTYSSRKVSTTCPRQHVTCCKGYVLVANNCLPLSKLPAVSQDIIHLQQHGYLDKLVG